MAEQLKGLIPLLNYCRNKTVLDVGCAEGLISIELAKRGAKAVHGLEIVADHVKVANKLRGGLPCTFEVADVNDYVPVRSYDVVIMLAILHKLRYPTTVCKHFAAVARKMVVLRLSPDHAPSIVDPRSGEVPHHVGEMLLEEGFALVIEEHGHLNEWVGYYKRETT